MKNPLIKPIVKILCLSLMLLSLNNTTAQIQENDFWEHVRIGGGIALSVGNGYLNGTLAPSAIYQFNPQIAAGVGMSIVYNSFKNSYTSTTLGGSLIGLYNVIPELQLSTEFEMLNVTQSVKTENSNNNYWYPALFVGAGFHDKSFTIGIRYDVLYDNKKSIYTEAWAPFVRIYF